MNNKVVFVHFTLKRLSTTKIRKNINACNELFEYFLYELLSSFIVKF